MPAPPSTAAMAASQIPPRAKYHRRDLRREVAEVSAEIDNDHAAVAAVDRPRSLRAERKDDKSSAVKQKQKQRHVGKMRGGGTVTCERRGRLEKLATQHVEVGNVGDGSRWTPRVLYTWQNAQLNSWCGCAHVELFFRENSEMGARLRISDGEIAKNRTDARIYRVKQLMMHIAIPFDDAAMTDSPDVENDSSQDDADFIVETDGSLDSIS